MLVETALKMQCGTVWRSWKEQLRFASGESRGNKHTTRQPSKHKGSKTHSLSLTCCFFIPTAFILHKQAAPIHLLKVPLSNHIFQKHFQLRPNFSQELWSQWSPSIRSKARLIRVQKFQVPLIQIYQLCDLLLNLLSS